MKKVWMIKTVIHLFLVLIIAERKVIPACSAIIPARCPREGANKRGNSSRLTQSFHFFMFEPI
ncbi:hypothetical protein, partial [Aeromonas veronii]|uniref:hypothetical protein n=1 Tax=Aeromonas veronii TaxID=654 RepID=UPI003D25E4CA